MPLTEMTIKPCPEWLERLLNFALEYNSSEWLILLYWFVDIIDQNTRSPYSFCGLDQGPNRFGLLRCHRQFLWCMVRRGRKLQ